MFVHISSSQAICAEQLNFVKPKYTPLEQSQIPKICMYLILKYTPTFCSHYSIILHYRRFKMCITNGGEGKSVVMPIQKTKTENKKQFIMLQVMV